MKIDQLSTFQQAQVEVPNSGAPPKEHLNLPKDVIEALEDDDLEKALFLLGQHQKTTSFMEGFFPEWISFSLITSMFPKKKLKRVKSEPVENKLVTLSKQLKALASKIKIQLEQLMLKTLEKTLVPIKFAVVSIYIKISTPIIKYVVEPAKVAIDKITEATRKVTEALKVPFKYVGKQLEKASEKIQEKFVEIREKIVELKEKLDEYSKPIKEWLNERAHNFVENSTIVKQALGAQVVNLMKAVDLATQVVAYTLVPFKFAAEQTKRPAKWLKDKAEKLSKFFKEAKKWGLQKWKRFKRPISKKFLIFARAFIRVSSLLVDLLNKIKAAILRLYKRLQQRLLQRH